MNQQNTREMIRTAALTLALTVAGWAAVVAACYAAMTYGGVWTDDHIHHP